MDEGVAAVSARVEPWVCALCEATLAGTIVRRAQSDKGICDYCEGELARTGRKRCRSCGVPKSLDLFGRDKRRSDERKSYCLACCQGQSKEWRKHNPDYGAAYRATHQEEIKVWGRTYRERNLEQIRERARVANRRTYARDPAAARARQRAWVQANKEHVNAKERERMTGKHPERYQRRKLRMLREMRGQST